MSSYIITGKLGSGKSLVTVGKMFDYLARGKPVATNLDLFLDKYLLPTSKKTVIRLPDKPTLFDLEAMGSGNDSPEEEENGLLVLDELGSWFNSRSWQDKSRQPLLDWFIHARKNGWDLMLLVQDIDMLDKQLIGMLAEHLVVCRRLDRIKIPVLGWFAGLVGYKLTFPKVHSAKVHYGENEQAYVVERWLYRARHLYPAFDTKQKFSILYDKGVYSVLSPWHVKGRYMVRNESLLVRLKTWLLAPPARSGIPVPLKPKQLLVNRIMKLPDPVLRVQFINRFIACGSL